MYINKNLGYMEKYNIKSKLYGTTTGSRNIQEFLDGVTWWSCGDGQDIRMTKKEIAYSNSKICEGSGSALCKQCKSLCNNSIK